jgi:hypothetical protein
MNRMIFRRHGFTPIGSTPANQAARFQTPEMNIED